MVHIENSVLYQGAKGVAGAIQTLRDVLEMVNGTPDENKILSQKVDGSPAVFVGMAPDDGQFFVAKKRHF